jgi:hypothetical protein
MRATRRTTGRGLNRDGSVKNTRRISVLWSACVVGWCLSISNAASAETIDDLAGWAALFAHGALHTQQGTETAYKWWFDGQLRLFDDADGFGQSLVRPGVGYELSERATAWVGYAWIRTSPAESADFDENRIWQQLTWSKAFASTNVDLRSRMEQRFVETGSDTGGRFRQMAALRRPLQSDPRFTVVAWDEVFIHLNDTDWGARDGFDQNRAFLGFGWRPEPESTWRVETGYLHQFIDRPLQDDLSNHILSINLFWTP